ncbi:MAG: SpoIVB peptidase [Clostridia bacterium]|nr:SpoIVB peptidase [Clostridia bacterium]
MRIGKKPALLFLIIVMALLSMVIGTKAIDSVARRCEQAQELTITALGSYDSTDVIFDRTSVSDNFAKSDDSVLSAIRDGCRESARTNDFWAETRETEPDASSASADESGILHDIKDVRDTVNGLLFTAKKLPYVFVGGNTLGISIDSQGVTVIGISEITTAKGKCCPALEAGIEIGDVITKINGEPIKNTKQINDLANMNNGESLQIGFLRRGEAKSTELSPKLDITQNKYRLGIWVKEGSSGIGTLTFVTQEGEFGCLGHPIIDTESGEICKISGGSLYFATITGIVKGEVGKAGELKGSFTGERIGAVEKNNDFGVYGILSDDFYKTAQKLQVADIDEVKTGKAEILCTLDGAQVKSYEIEIVKAAKQPMQRDKGLVIRVTDDELLSKTNGIVQGMSGSPIIQNGKLIGAVTHVFVNDPSRGFGIYARWMYENAVE